MPVVTVLPLGLRIVVEPGESLMAAAHRQGCRWPSVCGGIGQCTTCAVRIESGEEHLPPMSPREAESLALYRGGGRVPPGLRLACQLQVGGEIVVFKRGVRPPSTAGGGAPHRALT